MYLTDTMLLKKSPEWRGALQEVHHRNEVMTEKIQRVYIGNEPNMTEKNG